MASIICGHRRPNAQVIPVLQLLELSVGRQRRHFPDVAFENQSVGRR